MKKFSFIIPAYNCASYIETCIDSIRKIGLENYEIILINDGSSDTTGVVCTKLSKETTTIKYFFQENQGVSAARNKGIMVAEGDYLIFVDADDNIDPDKMKLVLHEVEHDPDMDLAIFGLSFDYYHNQKCYRRDILCYPEHGCLLREKWIADFEALYSANALSPIWNKVFRREIIEKYSLLFNTDMFLYEDLEFSIRYLAHCNTIFNLPDPVYHYRQSEDEGNAGRRLNRIEKLTEVVDHIEAALDELIIAQKIDDQSQKIKTILLELYCVIAREKIAIASRKEIDKICVDFADWMSKRGAAVPEKHVAFIHMIIQKNVSSLIWQRRYTRCRHKIAVWIKSTRIYHKFCDKR